MDISSLFPSRYLKAEDLQGRTVTVTIQETKVERMGQGEQKEDKAVLYFQGKQKGLILNRTNALAIAALFGTETNNWRGKKVTLFPSTVRAFGKQQNVIRVREGAPGAPTPTPQSAVEEAFVDEDFDGEEEPGDGDDLFAPAASSLAAQGAPKAADIWQVDDAQALSPPRQNLAAAAAKVFGSDWTMAAPWLIHRWTKEHFRDHVVDSEELLSDDQCDLLADDIKRNGEVYKRTWPAQKAAMLQSTQ